MNTQTPQRLEQIELLERIATEEYQKMIKARPDSFELYESRRKYADAKYMADLYRKHEEPSNSKTIRRLN